MSAPMEKEEVLAVMDDTAARHTPERINQKLRARAAVAALYDARDALYKMYFDSSLAEQQARHRAEALVRGNQELIERASKMEAFAYAEQARADEAEAWRQRHAPTVEAAHKILEAARPLILNLERLRDANDPSNG